MKFSFHLMPCTHLEPQSRPFPNRCFDPQKASAEGLMVNWDTLAIHPG
jgi:hypothetical protein